MIPPPLPPRPPLRDRLPPLQRSQTHFARGGVTLQQPIGGPGGGAWTPNTVHGQRISEVGITRQRPARTAQESNDTGAVIGVLQQPHRSGGPWRGGLTIRHLPPFP